MMAPSRSLLIKRKVLCLVIIAAAVEAERKKKKKIWSREWLLRRNERGCCENLMRELALEDQEGYRRWLRMSTADFEFLLERVAPLITKKTTNMRQPIKPEERLALTLRYLATGETQTSLSFQFRVAQNTISIIIREVCQALYATLKDDFMKVPRDESSWKMVADGFWQLWNFPMCIGAMDGKHIMISCPPRSGSAFFNYKNFTSIVLLALVDANLQFIYVDVGTNGRISDGGVWAKSTLKRALDGNWLYVPQADCLPNTTVKVPYVVVADDAFPLTTNIMKPYAGKDLDQIKRIFNYRLSRARRVVENAFGVLAARFRMLKSPIMASCRNIKMYVLAACVLHNFLGARSGRLYLPPGSLDEEDLNNFSVHRGDWRMEANTFRPFLNRGRNATNYAKEVQKRFAEYFCSVGAVGWQERMSYLH